MDNENEKQHEVKSGVNLSLSDADNSRLLIRNAFERRRQAIVYALASKFVHYLDGGTDRSKHSRENASGDWLRIESLSQLRAAVGGRFQNLKQKWVNAGFPLREHRGDREQKAEVDSVGWIDLSAWISKQGFETRLAGANEPWLFEVKKVG